MSRTTIYRAIKFLSDNKYLHVSKMGNVNVYHLNDNVVWNSWGTERRYSEFSATIVLAESEQKKKQSIHKKMKKINVLVEDDE